MANHERPHTRASEAEAGGAASLGGPALLANERFLLLWITHAVSQAAHNAILFTLLIIVTKETGSTTHGSLLVLSFVVPAMVVGLAAGVLVDRSLKRTVLVVSSLGRAGVCLAFLFAGDNVWAIYGLTASFSALSQFFTPAVAAVIPSLVPRWQLMAANGLFNVTLTGSQFVGMVILAPLLLKSFGADTVFITALVLYIAAAALMLALPHLEGQGSDERAGPAARKLLGDIRAGSREALRQLRSDRAASVAMAQLMFASSLILVIAVLIPIYIDEVLRIGAENAAFVFAPAGIGAAAGLRMLHRLERRRTSTGIAVLGLAGLALGLLTVGIVEPIGEALTHTSGYDPFGADREAGLAILVALTMAGSIPVGLGYALVNASAQTVLHERAPAGMHGRYFATQIALANGVSIPPLLLIGALSDLGGVTPVILALAAVVAASGWVSHAHDRTTLAPITEGRSAEAGERERESAGLPLR